MALIQLKYLFVVITLCFFQCVDSLAQTSQPIVFTDVATSAGIDYVGKTFGSSWVDIDEDGDLDLYMSCHTNYGENYHTNDIPRFFINNSGLFTEDLRLVDAGSNDWHGGSFFDFDKDGDLDFLGVTGGNSGNVFMVNGTPWLDKAAELGLLYLDSRGRTATPCDINKDGYTDVVLSCLANGVNPSTAFLNDQGERFSDAAALFPPDRAVFTSIADFEGLGQQDFVVLENKPMVYSIVDGVFQLKSEFDFPRVQSFVIQDFNGDLLPDIFITRGRKLSEVRQLSNHIIRGYFYHDANTGVQEFSFQTVGELVVDFSPFYNQYTVHIGPQTMNTYEDPTMLVLYPHELYTHGAKEVENNLSDENIYIHYTPSTSLWTIRITNSSASLENFGIEVSGTLPLENLTTQNVPTFSNLKDKLLFNSGNFEFQDINQGLSLGDENGVAVLSADFDNDMDMDIYVVNSGYAANQPNILLENDGFGNFTRIEDAWGAVGDNAGLSESATLVDFDNDGFMDIYVCNGRDVFFLDDARPHLYRNEGNENHWIKVDLKGVISTTMGLHSHVKVFAGGKVQDRYQNGGTHKFSQNDTRLHFGLSNITSIDSVTVDWPSGIHQVVINPEIDQILKITEPAPACQAPQGPTVIEIGFGSSNPRVGATWSNPEGTNECEVRGGRILLESIGTGSPVFQNLANTQTINQTDGTSVNFNVQLYNNSNIGFVVGQTYGFEVRCRCSLANQYSDWSGLQTESIFTVPSPP